MPLAPRKRGTSRSQRDPQLRSQDGGLKERSQISTRMYLRSKRLQERVPIQPTTCSHDSKSASAQSDMSGIFLPSRRASLCAVVAVPFAASAAFAEEGVEVVGTGLSSPASSKVFFEVNVDGEPAGRVLVECANNLGGERLFALAKGENRDGRYVSYLRRLEVVDVTTGAQGQISTSPVRELVNLDGSVLRDFPGGQGGEMLRDLVQSRRETITGDSSASVWLRVFDDDESAPSQKLVSKNGRLILATDQGPPAPNGTAVTICTSQSACGAELTKTHVYVGRVVQGAELVDSISELPTVPVNRKLQYGSNLVDIAAKRQNRTFKKVFLKAGTL